MIYSKKRLKIILLHTNKPEMKIEEISQDLNVSEESVYGSIKLFELLKNELFIAESLSESDLFYVFTSNRERVLHVRNVVDIINETDFTLEELKMLRKKYGFNHSRH